MPKSLRARWGTFDAPRRASVGLVCMGRTFGAAMLLVLLLGGCSPKHPQTGSGDPPEPSPVGVPAGDVVSASLGAAGGTASSADGRISVTIPAGALSADTPIGIQPITN